MAQTTVVKLVDDIDGGEAEETLAFALDGKAYEIELNKKNATTLRKALAPYVQHGRLVGRPPAPGRGRGSKVVLASRAGAKTMFSELSIEEKERFRSWASMPTARRVGDGRVQSWIDAGRP